MENTGIELGFETLISLILGIAGAFTIWYSLKNKVEIQQLILTNTENDITDLKNNAKICQEQLHKRVDSLKRQVEANREKTDESVSEIKGEMNAMELRIIQAIHDMKK